MIRKMVKIDASLIFSIVAFCFYCGCSGTNEKKANSKNNVTYEVQSDSLILNHSNWQSPLVWKNSDLLRFPNPNIEEQFVVDNVLKRIYVYDFRWRVRSVSIPERKILKDFTLMPVMKREDNFILEIKKDFIIYKSSLRLIVFDKSLNEIFSPLKEYFHSQRISYEDIRTLNQKFEEDTLSFYVEVDPYTSHKNDTTVIRFEPLNWTVRFVVNQYEYPE